MGKSPRTAQNGEVPSNTALSSDATASSRQRPEEILAQTLSAPPHPEATDGWSSRGRRIFLIAMAVAGVILVVAGLLVTKELAPGPGNPTPVESGPGNGLANQLLQSSNGGQPATTAAAPSINIPLPTTPVTRPAQTSNQPSAQVVTPPAPATAAGETTQGTTPTTTPPHPTTTLPCGLLSQGLESAGIPVCKAGAGSGL
jgi:hypothetical protein